MAEKKTRFLAKIFEELNNNQIEYCVLRNYDNLPYDNTAKDIDIIIRKRDQKMVDKLIYLTIKKGKYIKRRLQYLSCYIIFFESDSVKLDFFYDYSWKVNRLLSSMEVLKYKYYHQNGFFALDKTIEACFAWHKPIIYGGNIKERYTDLIIKEYKNNPDKFIKMLLVLTDKNIVRSVVECILKDNLKESIRNTEIVRNAATKISNKTLLLKIIIKIQHVWYESKDRIRSGKKNLISLHGPDGAGKSTVASTLRPMLAKAFCIDESDVIIKHFRPYVLPNISVLLSNDKQKALELIEENISNPHEAESAGFFSSILRLAYYSFDYAIGFWIKIFPLTSRGKIVIFDRYYIDYYVDSLRSRINAPKFLISLFSIFIVKPYASFALLGDEEVYYNRKKELDKEEIKRQVYEYTILSRRKKYFFGINGEGKPEVVASDILAKYINKRCKFI